MRELTKGERRILEEHEKWLKGEGGERADFSGANLSDANLFNADLRWANLEGANLYRANLRGANLEGANLFNADLRWAKGILCIGPIGSRYDLTHAFFHNGKAYVRCGCFSGTLDEFSERVKERHEESSFGKEYKAAIAFIKEWVSLHFGEEG